MTLDAGHLVLLPFPHTDLSAGKKRPALVVTSSQYNSKSNMAILAYVTSQPQFAPWSLAVTQADNESGRLVQESWICVDRLATDQELIQGVVAKLNSKRLKQVRRELLNLLSGSSRKTLGALVII